MDFVRYTQGGVHISPSSSGVYFSSAPPPVIATQVVDRKCAEPSVAKKMTIVTADFKRNPHLGMGGKTRVEKVFVGDAHKIPATRIFFILAVRLMFYLCKNSTNQFVVSDDIFTESDARIVVEVSERARFFVYIPKSFLCEGDIGK